MDQDMFLIKKMKAGNQDAITDFVQKYYPAILKYCQYHLFKNDLAEDLTQETFERFFRNFNQYQHYGKALNYLYVIARNVCHDHRELQITENIDEHFDIATKDSDTDGEVSSKRSKN